MESKKCKLIKNFISLDDSKKIINWIDSISHKNLRPNQHLKELSKELKGISYIFDISNTDLTKYITGFQSIYDVSNDILPDFILDIIEKISKEFGFPKDNVYLQAIDMANGGRIKPHYDASIDGYINYKCNISVLSDDYELFIGDRSIMVSQGDIYGFEASLYKHWTNEFTSRRVLLSFGFILPYSALNRTKDDPRVRLGRRIEKYFQSEINTKKESTKE